MADPDPSTVQDRRAGWRRLGYFWLGVLSLMTIGGGAVEWSGRPDHRAVAPVPLASPRPPAAASASPPPAVLTAAGPLPSLVAEPDAAMLEPAGDGAAARLPRIAADGRMPMRAYAARFDQASRRPRVAILLAGIGLNEAESDVAIRTLPAGVSLAISPYGANLPRLLAAARAAGHEYLIAIPMEPAGFPLNDPGPEALLVSAPGDTNFRKLHWALSRIEGYVGATGVIGTMRGERLAAMTDQMDAVLSDLAGRGLLYIDPREGRSPVAKAWGRQIEVTIDDPADRDTIDARLTALEQIAKDNRAALGLVMRPTPVAVARVAAWASGLADRGTMLAPVSALAVAPVDAQVKVTERH